MLAAPTPMEVPPKLELGSQEKPCPSSWMFLMCRRLDGETAGVLLSTREDLQRDKVSCYVILRETCTIRGAGNRERHFWRHRPSLLQVLPRTNPSELQQLQHYGRGKESGKDRGEDSQGCITFPG